MREHDVGLCALGEVHRLAAVGRDADDVDVVDQPDEHHEPVADDSRAMFVSASWAPRYRARLASAGSVLASPSTVSVTGERMWRVKLATSASSCATPGSRFLSSEPGLNSR
jgi:hypothetical protein